MKCALCQQCGQFRIYLGVGEVRRNANDSGILAASRQWTKVFWIEGNEYTPFLHCEPVHATIGKAALFKIVYNVFHIELTIEGRKGRPMRHVFIEEQFTDFSVSWFQQVWGLISRWYLMKVLCSFVAPQGVSGWDSVAKNYWFLCTFHGVSSGNQHPYLLKSRYGKVSFFCRPIPIQCYG